MYSSDRNNKLIKLSTGKTPFEDFSNHSNTVAKLTNVFLSNKTNAPIARYDCDL